MRKLLIGFLTILFLSAAYDVLAENCDPSYGFVHVKPRGQETGEWCWAASEQMAMARYGDEHFHEQCSLATDYLNPQGMLDLQGLDDLCLQQIKDLRAQGKLGQNADCCAPEHKINCYCARPGWPDFKWYGFNAKNNNNRKGLEWDNITDQICRDLPIVITIGKKETEGGHQMVMNGYKVTKSGTKMVWVIDPSLGSHDRPGTAWRSFERYYVEIGPWGEDYEHSTDFTEICPNKSVKDGKCK